MHLKAHTKISIEVSHKKICIIYILGSLTKADKEMIVVATSAENNCLYCIVAHGALQRIYSKNPMLADQVWISFLYYSTLIC